MIRQITGTIADRTEQTVVVVVQGIGYLIHTNIDTTRLTADAPITFHTYLAVRETALDLYGFATRDELEVFEQLLTLPKIGPKSALQILTQADVPLLKEAVGNEDPAHLTKLSGITKKTAEKIVLGLKDTWEIAPTGSDVISPTDGADTMVRDTIDALIALGYPQSDARKAVQQLAPTVTNTNDAVKAALQILNQL